MEWWKLTAVWTLNKNSINLLSKNTFCDVFRINVRIIRRTESTRNKIDVIWRLNIRKLKAMSYVQLNISNEKYLTFFTLTSFKFWDFQNLRISFGWNHVVFFSIKSWIYTSGKSAYFFLDCRKEINLFEKLAWF